MTTSDQRSEACARVLDDGEDCADVAPDYGVQPSTVKTWIRAERTRRATAPAPAPPRPITAAHPDDDDTPYIPGWLPRHLHDEWLTDATSDLDLADLVESLDYAEWCWDAPDVVTTREAILDRYYPHQTRAVAGYNAGVLRASIHATIRSESWAWSPVVVLGRLNAEIAEIPPHLRTYLTSELHDTIATLTSFVQSLPPAARIAPDIDSDDQDYDEPRRGRLSPGPGGGGPLVLQPDGTVDYYRAPALYELPTYGAGQFPTSKYLKGRRTHPWVDRMNTICVSLASETWARRGRSYAHGGQVSLDDIGNGRIEATAQGTSRYKVTVTIPTRLDAETADPEDLFPTWREIAGRCTCPAGSHCKHELAVLYLFADAAAQDPDLLRALRYQVPKTSTRKQCQAG